jgi:hypothetical protein
MESDPLDNLWSSPKNISFEYYGMGIGGTWNDSYTEMFQILLMFIKPQWW